MNKSYQYQFRVSLHDTDAAGVMFFSHLFRYAHDAYEAFMTDIGFPLNNLLRQGRYHIPLAHAQADYLLPIRHADQVQIQLQIENLGATSFSANYSFSDGSGNKLATARTVHVLVDPDARTKPQLPTDLRDALARFVIER